MNNGLSLYTQQLLIRNWVRAKNNKEIIQIDKNIASLEKSNLIEIKWVGEETVKKLLEQWIKTQEELKKLSEEEIGEMDISVFGKRWIINFLKQ